MLKERRVLFIEPDDSELIVPTKVYLDGYLQRYLLELEDSEEYLNKMWTGCK